MGWVVSFKIQLPLPWRVLMLSLPFINGAAGIVTDTQLLPSRPPWFDHPYNMWWRVHILKLFIIRCSPVHWYFLFVVFRYSHHFVLVTSGDVTTEPRYSGFDLLIFKWNYVMSIYLCWLLVESILLICQRMTRGCWFSGDGKYKAVVIFVRAHPSPHLPWSVDCELTACDVQSERSAVWGAAWLRHAPLRWPPVWGPRRLASKKPGTLAFVLEAAFMSIQIIFVCDSYRG
jgi:hypothetical protein